MCTIQLQPEDGNGNVVSLCQSVNLQVITAKDASKWQLTAHDDTG
jgi:hypothetical protein